MIDFRKWECFWHEIGGKMMQKCAQNGTQKEANWSQNDTKMVPKGHVDGVKMVPKDTKKGAKSASGSCENVANVLCLLRVLKHWKWSSCF